MCYYSCEILFLLDHNVSNIINLMRWKNSLSSLFRFKRSNECFWKYFHVLALLIRHSFSEIKHFAKCLFMEHKSISSCSFCTVLYKYQRNKLVYYMWMISISKHCLNLIQKACVMVVVIRTKTQWITLEATIWSQVVYNQEM